MRIIVFILVLFVTTPLITFCGGGSGSGDTNIVEIAKVGSRTDVEVASTFTYTFEREVSCASVGSSTFFIVQAACSEANCQPASGVSATYSCEGLNATLDPVSDLLCGATHCMCLTTGITGTDGNALLTENVMEEFSTVTCTTPETPGAVTVPSVRSLEGADGSLVGTTGSAGVDPSSFEITFSKTMSDSSVTKSGNITLTCGDLTPVISVAKSETAENTYIVTTTDPWKYAKLSCTLTLGTGITDSAGEPLSSAVTYSFTTACAVSDDFNADSHSCYEVGDDHGLLAVTWDTWDEILANAFTFSNSDSELDMQAASNTTVYVYKNVTFDSGGFEMEIHFASASGFTSLNDSSVSVSMSVLDDRHIYAGIEGAAGPSQVCAVGFEEDTNGDGNFDPGPKVTASCPSGSEYCMKVAVEAGTDHIRAYRKSSSDCANSTYTDVNDMDPGATLSDPDDEILVYPNKSWILKIFLQTPASGTQTAEIGRITTSGINSSGQY